MLIISRKIPRLAMLGICLFLTVQTTGCARSLSPDTALRTEINDPIEPFNRAMFSFNNVIDRFLLEPTARLYNALFPGFARDGVQNVMRNLKSPLTIANSLLQGNVSNAGKATARFLLNSTAGIGGLIDVAAAQGMPYVPEDFGQTLAVWGVGDGFYVVLPILGPSSLRDTVGMSVDSFADPLRIWSYKTGHDRVYYIRNGIEGLDNRARLVEAVRDLRRNSLDYYATIRSAYSQKRASMIHNEIPQSAQETEIPDYDDDF